MEIITKKIEKEFRVCDKCGYDGGFHVSFVQNAESIEIILICPSCRQQYTINWKITIS